MKNFSTTFFNASLILFFAVALAHAATAQVTTTDTAHARADFNGILANEKTNPPKDDPKLPRVLLIGDSISVGYTPAVRAALLGKFNVHRPLENCGPTTRGLAHLDAWLGKEKWDVIHFNFGLHDLAHIKNNKYDVTGIQRVPLAEYEKNLEQIVVRLEKTGAALVWASTTPTPAVSEGRKPEDPPIYNEAAKKIMERHHIPIDDLYGAVLPKVAEVQIPSNVHYYLPGYEVLAQSVANSVIAANEVREVKKSLN